MRVAWWVLIAAIIAWQAGSGLSQTTTETFGCEANPTGDPIGGGPGYRHIMTRGDFTVRTAGELLAAFGKARAGQVIFVPDGVEIDLTGMREIPIPGGMTLAGTRGLKGSDGARIVFRERQKDYWHLFRTDGDFVRITGLRFVGPDGEHLNGEGYSNLLVTRHFALEVDNCEISNWGYGAIVGQCGAARLYVHHCYIHHGYGAADDGYGISLDMCDARIIANKLGPVNNHVVSGTGRPGTSYEAAYNLVMPPRGNFDMHGGMDRGDGTMIGGDWMHIHHNTFPTDDAGCQVLIRGFPSQGAEVHHNWFPHPAAKSVVQGMAHVYRNVFGTGKILED